MSGQKLLALQFLGLLTALARRIRFLLLLSEAQKAISADFGFGVER